MDGIYRDLINLALVCGMVVFFLYLFSKFKLHSLKQNSIKVIASIPLGHKGKLVLVEAANKTLLLGVTSSQISILHAMNRMSTSDIIEDESKKLSEELQDAAR